MKVKKGVPRSPASGAVGHAALFQTRSESSVLKVLMLVRTEWSYDLHQGFWVGVEPGKQLVLLRSAGIKYWSNSYSSEPDFHFPRWSLKSPSLPGSPLKSGFFLSACNRLLIGPNRVRALNNSVSALSLLSRIVTTSNWFTKTFQCL